MQPNILLIDIEVAPILGYSWKKYDTNLIRVVRDFYILCYAYKWLGEKSVTVDSLRMHPEYAGAEEDDSALCRGLWALLDKADVVVAHNGNRFDIKKIQTRLAMNGMRPPSPFKSVDTLSVARSHFGFTSNKLDDLGKSLKLGQKLETGGFELWEGVMAGLIPSWKTMEKYNKQDVVLLENLYKELRPWMPRHPNVAVLTGREGIVCSTCGSTHLQSRGYYHTNSGMYQRFWCTDCCSWSRLRKKADSGKVSTIVCDRR